MSIKWNRWKIAIIITGIILLGWAYLLGKIHYYSSIDTRGKADAIVVLGASQWNGKPSPVFKSRLDHAYALYKDGFSDKIILTGGVGEGEKISEAMAGRDRLLEKGLGNSDILMEEKGRTSWQSLNEVDKVLKAESLNSVIFVSDGFHMMRLRKMANDLGMNSASSPVENSPISNNWLANFKYYIRESIVYLLYIILEI